MLALHHSARKYEVRRLKYDRPSYFVLRTSYFLLLLLGWPGISGAQGQPTFNKEIAPIIWHRCATCHRPGEIGPFSLITYDDVRRHAAQIAVVTARRIMPPWKPVAGKGAFQDERRLTDLELQTLQRWIAAGAAEGDAANLPPTPRWGDGWGLGTPDLIVRMPEAFSVRADGPDVFRTFVIPIPVTRPRYVRALEFRPGNARLVHHANIGVDRTRSSRQLDARDPEPGYVGGMVQDARYPGGQLLGWTPGQAPHAAPEDAAWRLEPGSDLVVQLHLQPTGKSETLQVAAGFFFTDTPPTRTPVGLRLGSESIDIPPGQRDYTVSDHYVLPVDVEVLAIQPHAHNLARRMEATATQPDGTTRPLITIADWDFRWQDVYRYVRPLELPKGTTIAMRYTYDNSSDNVRNPHHPPARVVWGQDTTDEMGDLWIQLVPRISEQLSILNDDIRRKALTEDLAAYTRLLRDDPTNPLRYDAVAELEMEAGRFAEAITHFRRSLALNPDSAQTQYNLAFALAERGERSDALVHFQAAIRIDPDYAQAHNNLGALLQLNGQIDDALAHYRRAVTLRSDNVEAHANLGQLLSSLGQPAEAADQFLQALALRPDHARALAGVAWIRATAWDPALRDMEEAIRLGERAADSTGRQDLGALDALAAAYASAGRYEDAVRVAQSGVAVAIAAGRGPIADQFRRRLELYQSRQPLRMPRP